MFFRLKDSEAAPKIATSLAPDSRADSTKKFQHLKKSFIEIFHYNFQLWVVITYFWKSAKEINILIFI